MTFSPWYACWFLQSFPKTPVFLMFFFKRPFLKDTSASWMFRHLISLSHPKDGFHDPSHLQETSAAMNVLVAIPNNSAVWAAKAFRLSNRDLRYGVHCDSRLLGVAKKPESPMGMTSHLAPSESTKLRTSNAISCITSWLP